MREIPNQKRLLKWGLKLAQSSCCFVAAWALAVGSGAAQEEPAGENEKALRYFKVLQKRPTPGYLFDRFYNAWLDGETVDNLEGFLSSTVEADGSTGNRLLLAFFYAKQGENVRALEQFRLALEKDPGSAETWYQKALVEQRTLDFDTAIADLDKALEANPKEALARDILQLQGRLHARNGDTEKAKAAWTKLLETNAGDESLQEDLVELQLAEGLYEEALTTAENLLASTKDPYLAVLRQMRIGDIHHRAGQKEEGLEAYGQSLAKVGNGTWIEKEIFAQIEQVFRREDDLTGLKAQFEKLLEQHPKRISIRRELVGLLAEQGEKEEAKKAFAEILALTPGERAIREEYIDMLAKMEMVKESIEQLELLIKQHPDDGELLIKLAGLQHRLKDDEAAQQTLETYLAKSDKSEYAYLRTCRLLEKYELWEAAETVYQEVLTAVPDSEGVRDTYAAFLHRREKTEEAIAMWLEIAEGGGREDVVRIARTLSTRAEHQAAYDLLQGRYDDFKADAIYLTQLCTVALQLGKLEEAQPWALLLVELADDPLDLENAVALAAKIADKSDSIESLRVRLETEAKLPQEVCLLAELHERIGDSRKAEAVLATIQEKAPRLALAQLIRLHRQRGDFTSAAEAAVRLVESPGGRRTANVQKVVELYSRSDNLDKALEWIPEWKKLSPGSTLPWLTESRLLLDNGKSDAAINVLRRANQQFDENEDIRSNLARVYGEEGKLADATRMYMQLYEEAESVSAKLRWVRQLASASEMAGKSKQLLEQFEERRRGNRTSIVPLLALAEIHQVENNYESRRQSLLEAARIKPKDVDLLLEIARVEESEMDYKKALDTLQRALALEDSRRVRTRIAKAHFSEGEYELGFQILREMAAADLDAKGALQLAQSIIGTGDWEYAVDFLGELVEQFADHYQIGYLHAVALEENGEPELAASAFAALLENTTEISAAPVPSSPNVLRQSASQRSYQEMVLAIAPKSLVPLMGMNMNARFAYQHRHHRSGYGSFGGMAMQQSLVQLPANLKALYDYALTHLTTLGRQLEEDDWEATKEIIKERFPGIEDFILDTDPNSMSGRQIAFLLEDYPDNEALLAMAIIQSSYEPILDVERLPKAVEKFREDHPQLAFLASLSALRFADAESEAGETSAKTAFELLEKIEDPSYFVINALLAGLSVNRGAPTFDISEEQRQVLTEKMIEWYGALEENSPYRNQLFPGVAMALGQRTDLSSFVKFLDDAMEETAMKSRQGAIFFGSIYGRSNRGTLLQAFAFPPQALPGVPPQVVGMLGSARNNHYARQMNLDVERLKEAVDHTDSELLKLLVQIRIDSESDETVKQMEGMLEAEEPNLDTYILAAAHAGVVKAEPAKAVGILKRAKYLPMTRGLRQKLDASIVAWTLETTEPDEATLTEGRDAALRLRRGTLSLQQRQELVGAMEQLGMSGEAEKLEKKMVTARPSAPMNPFSSSRYRPQSQSQVQKLLSEGKQEQAMKLLANDLKGFAVTGLNPLAAFNNRHYEETWLGQLAGYGLADELLAAVDPGDTEGYRQRANWAYACEILGETEQAIEIYRGIMESRPKDDGVRLRLVMLLLTEDTAEGLALINDLGDGPFQALANQLRNLIRDDRLPFEKRMEMFEAIASAAIEREKGMIARSAMTSSTSAQNIVEYLNRVSRVDNVAIGQLYQTREAVDAIYQRDESQQASAKKYRKRLRQAHDKICRLMLDVPSLSREGFRRLSGFLVEDGRDEQEIYELAKKALLDYKPPRGFNVGMLASPVSYNHNQDFLTMWTPEQFIVRHAFRKKERQLFDDIVATLEDSGRGRSGKELAKQLRNNAELFFCPQDSFDEVATTFLEKARMTQFGRTDYRALLKVFEAWDERQIESDITGMIFKVVEQSKLQNSGDGALYQLLQKMAVHQMKRGEAELTAYFDQLTHIYLGPEEKREALIKKNYQRNSVTSGTVNASLHAFLRLLNSLCSDPDLYFVVYDHYAEAVSTLFGVDNRRNLRPSRHPLTDRNAFNDFDKQIERLDVTGFVAGVEGFRTYGEFLWQIASAIRSLDTDLRDRYLEHLRKKETLGAGLLAAAANVSTEGYGEWFGQYHADIPKMSKGELAELNQYFKNRNIYQNLESSKELSEKATEALNFVRGSQGDGIRNEIEALLAAKRLSDLNYSSYRLNDKAREYLNVLLPEERERAQEVYWKAVDLVEDGKRSGQWHTSYGSGTFASHLLQNVLQQAGQDGAALNFIYDILSGRKGKSGALTQKVESLSASTLDDSLERLVHKARNRKSGEMKQVDAEVFHETLGQVAGVLDKKYWRYAYYPYFGYLHAVSGNDVDRSKAILPLIESAAMEGDYQNLAKELLVVQKLRVAVLPFDKPTGGDLTAEAAHVAALLDDETIPMVVRLDIARATVNYCGNVLPLESTLQAFDLTKQALAKRLPVRGDTYTLLMRWVFDMEKTDAWKEGMANIVGMWKGHYLSNRNLGNDSSVVKTIQEVIRLCAEIGDVDSIGRILNRMRTLPNIQLDGGWLLTLIRSAPAEQVKRIIMKDWTNLDWRSGNRSGSAATYDAEIEERLQPLLQLIENEDLKLFTEAFFYAMPDKEGGTSNQATEEDGKSDQSPRDQRLLALAVRLDAHEFKNPMIGEAVLSFLSESSSASAALAGQFEKASMGITPMTWNGNGVNLPPAQRLAKQRLFEVRMKNALTEGPEFMKTTMASIARIKTQNSYYQSRALIELLETFDKIWKSESKNWTAEARKANTAIWASLLTSPEFDSAYRGSSYRRNGWVSKAWIYDQLDGDGAAVDQWEKAEDRTKALTADFQFSSYLLNEINSAMNASKPDLARRQALALKFCRSQVIMKSLSTNESYYSTLFDRFVSHSLLSEEELLEIGPDLVEAAPRGGHAGAEWASRLLQAGEDAAALRAYEDAMAQLPEEGGSTLYSQLHLGKAKLLAKTASAADALAVLEAMDQERLNSRFKNEYANLRFNYQIRDGIETGDVDQVIPTAMARFESLEDRGVGYHDLAIALSELGRYEHKGENYKMAAAYGRLAVGAASLASKQSLATRQETLIEHLSQSVIAAGLLQEPETLISKGAMWRYLDDGSDQASAWVELEFDDTAWSEGKGELGYGDGDEVTELSFGPDENSKFTTTYFRHRFTIPAGMEIADARLELLRDDGAVVYLDGEEIVRQNLPGGEIAYDTFAPSTSSGSAEKTYFPAEVAPESLEAGEHVLAVEVHQRSLDSSDISFDLALVANELTNEAIFGALTLEATEAAIGAETWEALPAPLKEIDQLPGARAAEEGGGGETSQAAPPEVKPHLSIGVVEVTP